MMEGDVRKDNGHPSGQEILSFCLIWMFIKVFTVSVIRPYLEPAESSANSHTLFISKVKSEDISVTGHGGS
jgi:hypothetical protein